MGGWTRKLLRQQRKHEATCCIKEVKPLKLFECSAWRKIKYKRNITGKWKGCNLELSVFREPESKPQIRKPVFIKAKVRQAGEQSLAPNEIKTASRTL